MPPLPALQVRVPNPANALLQAEQIRGVRAEASERQRQTQVRNALRTAFQQAGGIPTDPVGQTALVNQIANIDPQTALTLRESLQPQTAVVSPGSSLVNRATGDVLTSVPQLPAQPRPPLSREAFEQQLALRQAGRPQTSVTVEAAKQLFGDPPSGFAWARNPDDSVALVPSIDPQGNQRTDAAGQPILAPLAVPIAGGPAEAEQREAAEAAAGREESRQRTANVVTRDAGRLRELIQGTSIPVTGAGSLLSVIPGTSQRNAQALVDTIRSNVGFDKLQEMRANSPTGGALGPVSDFENRLLQATLGSLELAQTEEQFLQTLSEVEDLYRRTIDGPIAAMNRAELRALADRTSSFEDLTDDERELVGERIDILTSRGE